MLLSRPHFEVVDHYGSLPPFVIHFHRMARMGLEASRIKQESIGKEMVRFNVEGTIIPDKWTALHDCTIVWIYYRTDKKEATE